MVERDERSEMDWPDLWQALSSALDVHAQAGRSHLLTEDALRFALILALEDRGISPEEMYLEVMEPRVNGKLDLVIGDPMRVAFELKFPRDSRTGISPDTMTLGELLKDFYRLARVDADDRWVVQLLNDRLCRFLARRAEVPWAFQTGDRMELPIGLPERLPTTAKKCLPSWATAMTVGATCVAAHHANGLALLVYRIE